MRFATRRYAALTAGEEVDGLRVVDPAIEVLGSDGSSLADDLARVHNRVVVRIPRVGLGVREPLVAATHARHVKSRGQLRRAY